MVHGPPRTTVKDSDEEIQNPSCLRPSTHLRRETVMDSDGAPEEFTSQQGVEQHEEIKRVRSDNTQRVARENKERRKKWAERRKQQLLASKKISTENSENEPSEDAKDYLPQLLPKNVVDLLAARERQSVPLDPDHSAVLHEPAPKRKN